MLRYSHNILSKSYTDCLKALQALRLDDYNSLFNYLDAKNLDQTDLAGISFLKK
jgi:hypothetical protein